MSQLLDAFKCGLVKVYSWFEGDHAVIEVRNNMPPDGIDTIVVWQEDEVANLFESGFVEPGKNAEKSILEYAESLGFGLPSGYYAIQVFTDEEFDYDPKTLTYYKSLDRLKKDIDRIVKHSEENVLFLEWHAWFSFPGYAPGVPDLVFRVGPDGVVRDH